MEVATELVQVGGRQLAARRAGANFTYPAINFFFGINEMVGCVGPAGRWEANAMIVGIVSDTHIPGRARRLPDALCSGLAGVDLILHAGDLVSEALLRSLEELAPTCAVAGNCDPPGLARQLGRSKLLQLAGHTVGLVHGDGQGGTTRERARLAFPDAAVVVFGHSHQPYCAREGGQLLVNPGSPTDRRREPHFSYALLHLEAGRLPEAEVIRF